ncbi:MAG: hypothetical protein ACXWDI_13135 [Nocardioides sp.]
MNHSTRGFTLRAAGLASLTVATASVLTPATAGETPAEGTSQLVALHDADGSQAPDKSHLNGSAQVASNDGRYVVFSTTSALVDEDTNGLSDVYLRDTVEKRTTLVSASVTGVVGNGDSFEPTISALGEAVAFTTTATNLFADDNGEVLDVVLKVTSTGMVEPVSTRKDGSQAGRNSFFPVISGDGLHVAFQTFGRFAKTDTDRREDVYVKSGQSGATKQVSLNARGEDVPRSVLVGDVSNWGRWVTFGNDHNAWVRDVSTGKTRRIWHEDNDPGQPFPMGSLGRPVISGDGRFAAFSTMSTSIKKGEKGRLSDIFRLNLSTGAVTRVVVAADGGQGNDHSFIPSLSFNGRYVGFSSFAENLVPGDAPGSDTYVRDVRTGTTYLASAGVDGPADGESGRTAVAISDDGRTLVYESYASNLVPQDTNEMPDVIAWRR